MSRLTFDIPEQMKRKFKSLVADEGTTVREVLSDYVYACLEFGIIDTAATVAKLNRLKMQEIDGDL